ncbi:O-antigen polymerase [Flavobacterium sp.]|uniref:O-antigen polymerase n=1 Tax=Flavobacterium sp. TaxID=239 RepID=UPI0040482ACF
MKIKFDKVIINQILFIICVVIPFFNNYELSFSIWSLILIATLRVNYSIDFLKYLSSFVIIFLLAIVTGFFFKHKIYYVIRDITYLLKPITGLVLGYQLFNEKIKKPFKFLVYAGVVIASYHLILVFYAIMIAGATNVSSIRYYAGYFNDYEVYIAVILIFSNKFNLGFSKRKKRFFLFILIISSFFYLARTNFIQFVILILAIKGFLVLNKKSITILTVLIFVISISYTFVYYYNPKRKGKGLDEFLYKIKVAPIEAFSTKVNRHYWKDFHDNYRSYENIRTIEQLSYNNTLFFGEGIGSQVDLKQEVFLGDMYLRKISILHNGYMVVLLKTGILGLVIYFFSIFLFFKKEKKINNSDLSNIKLLFIGTGVFLILSNWVFMGFYNLVDTKSLLIGFLFAYKNNIIKRDKQIHD